MAEQGRTTLKGYFETGDTPTQAQFEDLIDSVPNISDSGVSNTEFGYLNGVTSAIQTQIDGKLTDVVEDTTPQLGGNLDLNGNNIGDATAADLTKLNEVTATSTELNYVDGVTSSIQTQIDGKLANVIDDTTPQLGGDLDVNGNDITGNPAIDGRRAIITEADTSKTLALTDAGDFIITTSASATTVTIPTNASVAFPTGTEIDFIQKGAGALNILGDAGVTLNGVSGGSTAITAQWGGATIKKIDTDEWVIVGKINDVA